MITDEDIEKSRHILSVYRACQEVIQSSHQRKIASDEGKRFYDLKGIHSNYKIIKDHMDYVHKDYMLLLDGNISSYLNSDKEDLFLIGYVIIESLVKTTYNIGMKERYGWAI